ncbi:glycosyltransferase family 2 protein [Henriciella marina]|uniref:glycosyltransferase family 2 protein n=1 Tax=Henriciella marina TaxID=453851 RepID=UPI00037787AD|nr:glycosyltransferase family 2 protein [Henriciella marina]
MSPAISVITPSWNRASYLKNVWEGLDAQGFESFEWIVANDGSEDETVEVVRALALESNFPVTLICASQRVGKSRIDNEAVRAARGDFIIWCDSDDVLLPGALQTLIDTWHSIPESERDLFCGVSALCDTEEGVLGNRFYNSDAPLDMIWNEMYRALRADLVIFTRADLVRQTPFPEVDFLISESSVWNNIGVRKTRFLPVVLKRNRYGEVNAISHSGHMSYNRGHAHAIALTKPHLAPFLSRKEQLRRTVNYLRYCQHGEISLSEALRLWRADMREVALLIVIWPAALALSFKDRLQGKVRKTHREFLAAQAVATVTTEKLNHGS